MDKISVKSIDEKPVQKFFVNAGIYLINPKEIKLIPQNKFFDIDNRGNDVFVSLIYPKEIHKGFKLKVNDNLIIDFSEHVNFVAIKNGEHSPNGYLFSNGSIENLINTDNFHVKEIYNIINNYFKK